MVTVFVPLNWWGLEYWLCALCTLSPCDLSSSACSKEMYLHLNFLFFFLFQWLFGYFCVYCLSPWVSGHALFISFVKCCVSTPSWKKMCNSLFKKTELRIFSWTASVCKFVLDVLWIQWNKDVHFLVVISWIWILHNEKSTFDSNNLGLCSSISLGSQCFSFTVFLCSPHNFPMKSYDQEPIFRNLCARHSLLVFYRGQQSRMCCSFLSCQTMYTFC